MKTPKEIASILGPEVMDWFKKNDTRSCWLDAIEEGISTGIKRVGPDSGYRLAQFLDGYWFITPDSELIAILDKAKAISEQ